MRSNKATNSLRASILVLIGILICGYVVNAQVTTPGGEYFIHGIYTPTIANAQKIDLRPEPIDTIMPDIPVTYEMIPAKAEVPARVDSIDPAKLSVLATQTRLYKGYVKGGFGLYTTPLGELYFNSTRSRKNAYGVHVKHLSSNGGIGDVGPSDYSFNNADAFYTHFLRKHEITGRVIYDRRRITYYGYDELTDSILNIQNITPRSDDDLKQIYNDIGFAGNVSSMYSDSSKISHDIDLEAHSYSNLSGSSEFNLRIGAALGMTQGSETYGLGVLIDNNAYRREFGSGIVQLRQNGTLIGLTPTVTTSGEKYLVRVGAGMYVDAMGKTTFHFYPNAYLHYRLFDDILVPYIGVEGAKLRNSFRSLTRENPFLNGAPLLANSNKLYDLYGGLRGSFTSELGFDVRISQRNIDDMPLFVNNPNPPFGDQLAVVYEKVSIFNVSGTLHFHTKEAWDVHARIDVSSYKTEFQQEAWNLPPYQFALGANYNIRNKLILKAEVLLLGRRPAKFEESIFIGNNLVPFSNQVELDAFLDLYIGAEYRYTKRLSVFLDLSNISLSKYERWYRYPVQRGLVLGGFTYAF
ncbi:MAG: hypothetical protein M3R08_00040 [Bacteroidota bacterium]|nr:hypothetical protein [Bacteroidota bacterium]